MKTALITGVTGQDGSYLAELLLKKGYKVYGLNRRKAIAGMDNLKDILGHPDFEIVEGDMSEESRLFAIVRELQPDEIYNMASQSFVPYSWTNPIYTCNVNAIGCLRLLEAIRIFSPHTKFLQASSSEMFGKVQEIPQNEMTYHYPRSPYGCSKSFAFNITRNYRESYGIFAVNSIGFNHESERRGLQFVTRKITRTVAEIYHGMNDKLVLGNLDARRDWSYAPDVVEAMYRIMQHNRADDWVIASGESHTVREFVEISFKEIGIDLEWVGEGLNEKGIASGKVYVEVSDKFFRPAEVEFLQGDITKISMIMKPKVSFREMIRKMVRHDINMLKK